MIKLILRDKEGKFLPKSTIYTYIGIGFFAVVGLIAGVVAVADWGAKHQFQRPWYYEQKDSLFNAIKSRPLVIDIVPEVISPVVVVENEYIKDLTPVEQKVMEKWGYKDGVVALAIFDCGESGLDQYAVSHTGDLGIAQINWATWKKMAGERFGYNAADMFDVDKNLDVAYLAWDRGDGEEGNKAGTWDAWTGFTNGSYTRCFN